jgi:hypothetical protein
MPQGMHGEGGPFWRYVAGTIRMVRADAALYLLIAVYALAGLLFLRAVGAADQAAFALYFNRWAIRLLLFVPVGLLLADACRVIHRFERRRRLAFRRVFSERRIARLVSGTVLLFAFTFFQGIFTSVKNGLPAAWHGAFPFDRTQADIDAALHFGVDPWRLLHGFARSDALLAAVEWNYGMLWFIVAFGAVIFVATSPRADAWRLRYLACFMLVWIVVGNIFAGLFLSAGPAFHGYVTGDTARFAEQVNGLRAAGNASTHYQDYLWQLYSSGTTGFASGISAFPSIHVAVAAMNACFAWTWSRRLGVLAWLYTAFVLFSSVLLAWHYAIDGYAGILLATCIFLAVGKLGVARRALPARAAPALGW